MTKNPRLIDLAGKSFGLWTVLRQDGNHKGGAALWLSRCQCGAERQVSGGDLRQGKSLSCGCIHRDKLGASKRTHGETRTRLYQIWLGAKARCNRKTHPQFSEYGGRGILMCDEWRKFEVFRTWALTNGYQDDLSIDRIDNDKGYSPDNCRWADAKTQSRNRRMVLRLKDGRVGVEVAEQRGLRLTTYHARVASGWTPDDAVSLPNIHGHPRVPRKRNALGQYR